jgi:hypothetical protein
MFLKFSTAQGLTSEGLTFEDRDNFRAFKLVVQGDRAEFDAVRRATAGRAELPDEGTAWIFEDTLRRWPGVENDMAWQEKFSAMIEKARPHGWIDDQRKAIKAHIEWTAAS